MVELKDYSLEELEQALAQRLEQVKKREAEKREAYEKLRAELVNAIREKVLLTVAAV